MRQRIVVSSCFRWSSVASGFLLLLGTPFNLAPGARAAEAKSSSAQPAGWGDTWQQPGPTNSLEGSEYRATLREINDLLNRGNTTRALALSNDLVRRAPQLGSLYYYRGLVELRIKNYAAAAADFQQSLNRDVAKGNKPENVSAVYRALGISQAHLGRCHEALTNLEKAVALHRSHNNRNVLAWVLATCNDASVRDGRRAVELAKQVCAESQGRNFFYFDTLAAAEAETGDFTAAVEHEKTALRLLKLGVGPKPRDASINSRLEERLALYHAHQPYRETR